MTPAAAREAVSRAPRYLGTGDSAWVDVPVGEVVTLEFLVSGVGAPDRPGLQGRSDIFRNSPNPFGGTTEISFSLTRWGPVHLRIYDARGRLVRTLIKGESLRGTDSVTWDGRDDRGKVAASGIYFYELVSQDDRRLGRMTLLR